MGKILAFLAVIICAGISVAAQSETELNHHYDGKQVTLNRDIPSTRDDVKYVITVSTKPGVVQLGPRTTYLKEGLSTEAVLRVMGKPAAVSERNEQGAIVTSYEFRRGDGRVVIAEFIGNALVRSRTETHEQNAAIEDSGN